MPGSSYCGERWPPAKIEVAWLEPAHWAYLAEGALHLLVRYVGPSDRRFVCPDGRSVALRIRKVRPVDRAVRGAGPDPVPGLVRHLLGAPYVPLAIPVHGQDDQQDRALCSFLSHLQQRIQHARPAHRSADGLALSPPHVEGVVDLTSGGAAGTYMVEIKPKWLFRARAAPASRFRMHAVHRAPHLTRGEWEALYDPVDLASRVPERVGRAVRALQAQPGNNLRVVRDGAPVGPAGASQLVSALVDAVLATGLVRRLGQLQRALHLDGPEALAEQWRGCALLRSIPPFGAADGAQSAWTSWLLRPLEQEELAPLTLALDRLPPDEEGAELVWPPPGDGDGDGLAGHSSLPSCSAGEWAELCRLRQGVVAYTVGATLKDVSLLFRVAEREAEVQQVVVADVDGKPPGRLAAWLALDRAIYQSFARWAQSQSQAEKTEQQHS